jgi:menaquinone-dependent protoporphyrinogen oxidase
MKPYLVLYATREGHTEEIAEHLRETMTKRGLVAQVLNAADLPDNFRLADYEGALIAASVHSQRHEPEMVKFVKTYRDELESMPTVLLSVSLAEAGAEDPQGSPEHRAKSAADVQRMIDQFLTETGWHPSKIKAVAGALMYSKYNFFIRFIMKRIAAHEGGDTDTSRNYDYTDWAALDRLVDELASVKAMEP